MKILSLIIGIVCAADRISEELKVWRLTNSLSLLSFNFDFDVDGITESEYGHRTLDYFPP